jgi:hypothetical protein
MRDVTAAVISHFRLSPEEAAERLPSGQQTVADGSPESGARISV